MALGKTFIRILEPNEAPPTNDNDSPIVFVQRLNDGNVLMGISCGDNSIFYSTLSTDVDFVGTLTTLLNQANAAAVSANTAAAAAEAAVSGITGTPNTFTGYDASGNLYTIPNWNIESSGGVQTFIDLTPPNPPFGIGTITHDFAVAINPTSNADNLNQTFFRIAGSYGNDNLNTNLNSLQVENISFNTYGSGTLNAAGAIAVTGSLGDGVNNGTTNFFNIFDSEMNISSGHSVSRYTMYNGGVQLIGTASDVYGFGFYPTVQSCSTINNLTVLYSNPQIDAPVNNFFAADFNGYGLSAPKNFYGFSIGVNFGGNGDSFRGVQVNPGYNIDNIIGYQFAHSSPYTATTIQGATINISGNYSGDVTGINIDVSNATSPNKKVGLTVNGGSIRSSFDFSTVSNYPYVVDFGNLIGTTFNVYPGQPITNTDVFGNGLIDSFFFQDNYSGGSFDFGWVSQAAAGQIAGLPGKTASTASMMAVGFSVPDVGQGSGGTVTDMHMYKALGGLPGGGNLQITNMYGFRAGSNLSLLSPSNVWGISIEDSNAENFFSKSVTIGGVTKKVSSSSTGLEVVGKNIVVSGGNVNAASFSVGGVSGATGSFTAGTKVITVVNGLITSIV